MKQSFRWLVLLYLGAIALTVFLLDLRGIRSPAGEPANLPIMRRSAPQNAPAQPDANPPDADPAANSQAASIEAQPTASMASPNRTTQDTLPPTLLPLPTAVASPQPSATPVIITRPAAEQWKTWPVLPQVPANLRAVYQRGLAQGNDPHAFSILGDCQSQPDVFMGVFDRDPQAVRTLPDPMQETVMQFSGSFDRYSPTVKDGTTEGALLWGQWNDNKEKKCLPGETPLNCELRVHRPSIVLVHVGTHWEARSRMYLDRILDVLDQHGVVPVLVTKADNREKDERVNETLAALAEERDLPLWNFWATVQHLPDNGLQPGSDMYLSEAAVVIHREGALEALDAVWRAVRYDKKNNR